MSIAIRKPMTQDEFFRWVQSRDEPYEFDGIQPVAMIGASGNHGRIAGNIQFQLRLRLGENGPCEALAADAGVQTIRRYVIVEPTVIGLTVLGRTGDEPWRLLTLKAGDVLNLPEIGVEIPVDVPYARVDLDEAPVG